MKHKLVIWGASGHARVVVDIIRLAGRYEVVGFLDDLNIERHNTPFCGAYIIGGQEQLDTMRQSGVTHMLLSFGNCKARLNLAELARSKGFRLATAIHPKAIIAVDTQIGEGTVVAAGAVINPLAKVGDNVIINTCACVEHESVIEDGAHIGPGVCLGGSVRIGRGTWVGIGATVVDHIQIGAGAMIGAGAVVVNDIPAGVLAYGVPARVVRPLAG